jgi:RimJ/RimL family protein N-acetyltransferase
MGFIVIVERTYDVQLIESICFNPVIWETITEDDCTDADFDIDLNECWLKVTDKEVIGLYNLHPINGITLQIHPMILPEYRGEKAYRSGVQVLKWVIENTDYQKVFCYIPTLYRNVILFALRCGMVKEGINRRSWLKNGKIHDMVMLGITREEIEALI